MWYPHSRIHPSVKVGEAWQDCDRLGDMIQTAIAEIGSIKMGTLEGPAQAKVDVSRRSQGGAGEQAGEVNDIHSISEVAGVYFET
jgi:hypothetical protein